jgi:acyl-CoA thioester hydrolase
VNQRENSGEPAGWSRTLNVQWSDLDQNGHMRTTAYLARAEDSRMQYFASAGFTVGRFAELRIGPVIRTDELSYTAELTLLAEFQLTLVLAGLSVDGRKFILRNTFVKDDGRIAATVTSTGGWLDLTSRKLTTPPSGLHETLAALTRTHDFHED